MNTRRPIRVLVVDDSAVARTIITRGLTAEPGIEVVGTAADPYAARDAIVELQPDVMTLDVEMPRMDGVTFVKKLMPQWPLPIVMVSTLTTRGGQQTIEALGAGAVDFVTKPANSGHASVADMLAELRAKVKAAAGVDMRRRRAVPTAGPAPVKSAPVRGLVGATDKRLIAIGSSTGGVEALRAVLPALPANLPPVLVVQHMPPTFTALLATRLDESCALTVREARNGELCQPGHVYIAAGGEHLRVRSEGAALRLVTGGGDPVSGHRPSVDVLFSSVAEQVGRRAVGVILTGMGRDGADGLLAMRQRGARTVAQDEATSLVFGMPRVAIEQGAAELVRPIDGIASAIANLVTERPS
ncbi:MAG: chemotaxis response regulator protein-glutamate methylesterase [Myxococcales bacterium]|nr:chemotaxis response regulator protein-glutamate methylesterase [Myxococcales bacterium]MCB9731659.1 chemotaxis response regulator protein-glutamate methylesterase [Deltaproteobacteria bacterium]